MSSVTVATTGAPPAPTDAPADAGPTPVGPGRIELPLRATLLSPELPPDRLLVPGPPRERALAVRAWHVLARTAGADLPVRYLGTMPLFDGHRVYSGSRSDWVLLNLADDPLLEDRDGFPVPERVLKDLRRVADKVDFDALFVAHEVPRGAVVEDRPPSPEVFLPPPPSSVQSLSSGLGVAGQVFWVLAAAPLAISGLVAELVAGGAALVGGAVSLDPVLLGVVVGPDGRLEPGEPAAWFYLGHWIWDAE